MKANKLIEKLEMLIKEHGDQNIVYSKDDEGNEFNFVNFEATAGRYDDDDKNFDETATVNCFCIN